MEEASVTINQCWACNSDLLNAEQRACGNCHRWQRAPWKYLNLSNVALAVIAALVSTGLAVITKYESYQSSKDFNLFVGGQSLLASKRDLNFYIQNYSKLAILLEKNVSCVKNGNRDYLVEFDAVERFRSFPPLMPEQKISFVTASKEAELVEGDELKCKISFQNENRYKKAFEIEVRVSK